MSDSLIKVEGLSKKFCLSLKKSMWYGMQDLGNELRGRRHGGYGQLRQDEFWAVKDINFELKRGECLGLIGHNGAGKTTLLRMLNGLIRPDQGRIEMRGKVGALIALGAGFNPILTGRENIYVNASVLGMSKRQVDNKIDEIIDFAEIGEFIDSPVQTYSSGMNVRLGFAVAAILIEPDVLFLDEVLAVGDIGFAIKCLNAVRKMTNNSAVVFVSHSMQFISSFCTRVMVLEKGKVLIDSPNPSEGIDHYYSLVKHEQQISGTGDAEVLKIQLMNNGQILNDSEPTIRHGTSISLIAQLKIRAFSKAAYLYVYVMDEAMSPIICIPAHNSQGELYELPAGTLEITVPIGVIELVPGKYSIVLAVRDAETAVTMTRVQGLSPFRVLSENAYWGKILRVSVPSVSIIGSD